MHSLLCTACLVTAMVSQTTSRLPIPDSDAVEAARAKIREVFATDIKDAKSPDAKSRLAERLLVRGADDKESAVNRFAFFVEVRELYVQSGDMLAAFRAIDEMVKVFERPGFAEKIELVQRLVKLAKNSGHHRSICVVSLKLASDAAAAEDYTVAKECCNTAVTAAISASDSQLQSRAVDELRGYEAIIVQWQAAKEAVTILQGKPDDANANLKLGKYRCMVRHDWGNGIIPLSNSSDTELSSLAKRDISNPATVAEQVALADAWLKYAEQSKSVTEKTSAAERSAMWYEKGAAGSAGIDRLAVEKKLEAAFEMSCGRNFTKLRSKPPNGLEIEAAVDCKTGTHPLKLKAPFDLRKSWLLSFEFLPPNLDGGSHLIFFWGDERGGQDPMFVRIDGTGLAAVCTDNYNNRAQGLNARLSQSGIGQWIKVDFIHDALAGEMELYVNRRLVAREAMTISPAPDRKMPLLLGGTPAGEQRFGGQVRKLWLGNIP